MSKLQWQNIMVSACRTFHLFNNQPLYSQRFSQVMKFHAPGLAPVKDGEHAYHIFTDGQPAYSNRFMETFGFYENLATARDKSGWFHILLDGSYLYNHRYAWCGNFQNNACVVKDINHNFFHIDHEGKKLYPENYQYVGDFRDDIAVVQNQLGFYTHIKSTGESLHGYNYLDLDVFHKGFARAKDKDGWFHINYHGESIYAERYTMIEPFYNGLARVETHYGELLRINEQGEAVDKIRKALTTPFQKLSADIVGYWKTQTIKAAVDLNIFEYLPANLETISQNIGVSKINVQRLLKALAELHLITFKNNFYEHTQLSQYLLQHHPQSLYQAVKHWGEAHYIAWMYLAESLKNNKPMYEKIFNNPLFDWLDQDHEKLLEYQNAMTSYAKHDYPELIKLVNLSSYQTLIDAGGGEGTLLQCALHYNPHLTGILLERPKVAEQIIIPTDLMQRMSVIGFDLFKPWPEQADVIILSRVLHDWSDEQCSTILQNARTALNKAGQLLIIEMLLNDNDSNGGMLDMNMLVITGGKERNLKEYQALVQQADLHFSELKNFGNYNILSFHASNK